jgi:hypothetical protein
MIIELIETPIYVEVINSGTQGARGLQGTQGVDGRGVTTFHQAVILNSLDIANKFISLDAIPVGEYFSFLPSGGGNQRVGLDFIFDRIENRLTWLNLELENILEVGDQIDIDFFVAN